ncbi:MAG: alpha/beta hydrolase-fold protein [Acidobacteriota bacterium]
MFRLAATGRAVLIALLTLAPAATGHGEVERIESTEVPAPSLTGNRLGSPDVQRAAIYLPPSYHLALSRRYPVLYLLHGIFDTPEVWDRFFRISESLDRAIAAGAVGELIVVMPAGGNDLGGGFYRNSTVAGGWGDFVRRDLVTFVDANYRTLPRREARAIAGHSMGGFGAVWHAMTSADVFSVAYAMSPGLLGIDDDISHGNPEGWQGLLEMRGEEGLAAALERRDFWPVAAWAVCTSFLPDPDDEIYLCEPPYRTERGELVPETRVIDRFRDALPLYTAVRYLPALRSLHGLALDYGLSDQFSHIPDTTQAFSEVLAELGVAHELSVYDGDHRQQIGERLETVVLPWITKHLEPPSP